MPFGFHKKDKEKAMPAVPPAPVPPHAQQQQQQQQHQQPPQQQYSLASSNHPTAEKHPDTLDPNFPEFRIVRSTTTTQEEIFPPSATPQQLKHEKAMAEKAVKKDRRLSERLHLRGRTPSGNSEHVPGDLVNATEGSKDQEDRWEWRASQLAMASGKGVGVVTGRPTNNSRAVSDHGTDQNIQEAIRLHEAGDLENSTQLFKKLADPNGANNPLSQVLYGLALRHGWGVPADSTEAIKYLQAAAANSADIEQEALRAGMKKGGAAKGELVLAIFELGNCFRHGWGTEKDPIAAFNYYLTAANLGDVDAMNETGWCYLNGYGMKKKDKYQAAKYYRLAEANGNKTLGNSWIYKEKYDNPPTK